MREGAIKNGDRMADDQIQRPNRTNEASARGASATSSSDPLAELARLIGQTDPFGEYGRENARRAAAPQAPTSAPNFVPNEYQAAPVAPAKIPLRPYAAAAHHTAVPDLYQSEEEAPGYAAQQEANDYDAQQPLPHVDEQEDLYNDLPPPRRRVGILAIATVLALAVIGTAGGFGYRALFGSSGSSQPPPVIKADTAPSKIVPATTAKTPNKLIYDRVADRGQDERLVSREEPPVELKDQHAPPPLAPAQDNAQLASAPPTAPLGTGVISNEPKKIRTIAIRPDQLGGGGSQPAATPIAAAPQAPPPPTTQTTTPPAPAGVPAPAQRVVSNPPAVQQPANALQRQTVAAPPPPTAAARSPTRTAAVAPAATSGSYAVQVSSQRSEADAQAAYHSLQAKYPNQLGGRQVLIRKADLGQKGTFYRALVGPFATVGEANELCSGLKAAGGQCLIQKN
jgi:hypothetical protein